MGIETSPSAKRTSSTSWEKEPQPKQRVGVADYFAILGVGEDLVWKHAQQKASEQKAEEDDARLLERFYREIVDCSIVVADESSDPHPTSLVYTKHPYYHHNHAVAIPSPSPSDVASGVGTEVETVELEGWTIVQQTRPTNAHAPRTGAEQPQQPALWSKGQVWEANLDPIHGLTGDIQTLEAEVQKQKEGRNSTPLKDLRQKVQSTFQQRQIIPRIRKKFYLSYRRRAPDESNLSAISDLALYHVELHKATVDIRDAPEQAMSTAGSSVSHKGAAALLQVAKAGKHTFQSRVLGTPHAPTPLMDLADVPTVALKSFLEVPNGFEEWSIPEPYRHLRFPSHRPETPFKTILFPDDASTGTGIEAQAPPTSPAEENWQDRIRPRLIPADHRMVEDEEYIYVPILAIRRQRIGEEERFREDAAIVELAVSFSDDQGQPALPVEEIDWEEEERRDDDVGLSLLQKTDWFTAQSRDLETDTSSRQKSSVLGSTCVLIKRNIPLGFCDAAFSTSVLDRFPYKNYKGLPLPEEELPMFCYPTGCRLHRAKFSDAPLPQYYGFVVKNERGDSIYVSCVSFMEPLTHKKQEQLVRLSEKRRRVSLPHARCWARRQRRLRRQQAAGEDQLSSIGSIELTDNGQEEEDEDDDMNILLTGFDEMTTFENKTICLVSRYPYWTAFRRFLSHLHSASGSSSDLPLERYISHLLLAVPIPKPGGPSILIPLPTFNVPMMLWSPPLKDLPLADLPFERLVSCLDVPTIVTVVLGFLALERKVRLHKIYIYSYRKVTKNLISTPGFPYRLSSCRHGHRWSWMSANCCGRCYFLLTYAPPTCPV
jgi:hypothetical protein